MKTGNVKSRPTDLPTRVWVTPKLNRFVFNKAGFSDVHCIFSMFFQSLTQKPELGVKTQKIQVQKKLWVFTQYWFLRSYI